MRQIAACALLLPLAASADNTVPSGKGSWAQQCVARLEQARKQSIAIDTDFTKGRVDLTLDEEVVPIVEHVSFELELPTSRDGDSPSDGLWTTIDPGKGPGKSPASAWRRAPHSLSPRFSFEFAEGRTRFSNSRTANVQLRLPAKVGAKLQALWEAAADDCLRMK